MSSNMFMKIDGIKGESSDKKNKDQFEILSFSHGVSQPTSATRSSAGGGTVERCMHQDFSVSKYMDAGTADLNFFCCQGKTIKKVEIFCYRADESGDDVLYMTYTLDNCIVSNISVGGGGGDIPVENISFNYSEIGWDYAVQKEVGGEAGHHKKGWDLSKNTKK
jgi:type VI secretion system Hcp family effector